MAEVFRPEQSILRINQWLTSGRNKNYINDNIQDTLDILLDEGTLLGLLSYFQDNSVGYFSKTTHAHRAYVGSEHNPVSKELSVLTPFQEGQKHPLSGIHLEEGRGSDIVVYDVVPRGVEAIYSVEMRRPLVKKTGGVILQFASS